MLSLLKKIVIIEIFQEFWEEENLIVLVKIYWKHISKHFLSNTFASKLSVLKWFMQGFVRHYLILWLQGKKALVT